jgi:DNA recombination protein RmuC
MSPSVVSSVALAVVALLAGVFVTWLVMRTTVRASLVAAQRTNEHELASRQQAIADLVSPIKDALGRIDGTLQQVEVARAGSYESLMAHVQLMAESQRELRTETQKLASALRSPTVRGRWGEIQLRRVCEMAGMLPYCDFVEQASYTTSDGRLRPDVSVRLPGHKVIIVDAKAPLHAYLDAMDAPDDATRERKLRDHARHVRDHMMSLSGKSYWGQLIETPEFVVMFLPGETFFSAALQYDPSLIEYGVAQRVIPASPTTLIALLRSVAYGWQQERVAQNAEEISALGRELYDRLRVFAGHYTDLRRNIERVVESYNKSIGSLERSVFPQARRFRELGASSAPDLPPATEIGVPLRTLDVRDGWSAEDGNTCSTERPLS